MYEDKNNHLGYINNAFMIFTFQIKRLEIRIGHPKTSHTLYNESYNKVCNSVWYEFPNKLL